MIQTLFGNRNIERILFFLFVNERCYGAQLQTLLQVPLTPIQNGLNRLEKTGILSSYFEGKIRIYQFNPSFPLRWELENLLKKAYSLLPSEKKKQYCFIHKKKLNAKEEGKKERGRKKELSAFWERLLKIRQLSLIVKSRQREEKVIKTGKAEIKTHLIAPTVVTFQEKGCWFIDQSPDTSFSNSFRWTLDAKTSLITLEHLRHGARNPVFLFHLTSIAPNQLESVDAHLHKEDVFLGSIFWNFDQITFHWRIIGPQKNEELIYHYT